MNRTGAELRAEMLTKALEKSPAPKPQPATYEVVGSVSYRRGGLPAWEANAIMQALPLDELPAVAVHEQGVLKGRPFNVRPMPEPERSMFNR